MAKYSEYIFLVGFPSVFIDEESQFEDGVDDTDHIQSPASFLAEEDFGEFEGISVGIGWLCGPISTLVPSGMVITRCSLFDMIHFLLRLVMLYSFRFVLFSSSVGYNGE